MIVNRDKKQTNFLEFRNHKVSPTQVNNLDRVQEIRVAVLHAVHRRLGQRAGGPGADPPVRRGARPVLRQRVRARPRLQLLQSLPDPRRNDHRRRADGDLEESHFGGAQERRLLLV